MRLAVVMLTNGSLSGGAAKHLRIVMPMLALDPRIERIRVFVPEGSAHILPHNIDVYEFPVSGPGSGFRKLKTALAQYGPQVLFIPSARYLATPGARTVTMVRNMEPLETPFGGNTMIDRMKNLGRRYAAWSSCRKADRIIAVSDHVANYLIGRWSVPPAKVATVYHGVETPPEPVRPETLQSLGNRPFVFSAGSIRPARGLHDLVEAMAQPSVPSDLQLVFAGQVDAGAEAYETSLHDIAERHGISDRIHWAGRLGHAEMSWCFKNSDLFVMTSRAEACPNTVLEALSHGCLSVSGANQPMPEFFEDTAVYYDSGDPASLAVKMVEALNASASQREEMRAAAALRSLDFTWETCAKRTAEELEHSLA
ncbi:glycosyltransferase [Altererythrobacter confluentis]|uniref:Glycosyltransferase n=1 Tax=Allopontixanthobacter confluentis TaxID=1849021 RepID=A0A6L7GHX8_9SPHN|nr:glycosyltransferase family 4 protein [Allopontixanthobacter confluentis]MXP15145.1 glycosyltransferase [Allopontixanthobacter confluentis]